MSTINAVVALPNRYSHQESTLLLSLEKTLQVMNKLIRTLFNGALWSSAEEACV